MTTLSTKITKRPAAWTFVSGKVAALESGLQPRSFFDGILRTDNPDDLRSALGKSAYRSLFPDDKSLANVSSILDAKGKEIRAELFKLCPPHPLENYFGIGSRFRSFRTLFNRLSGRTGAPPGELEALFPVFAVDPGYADRMTGHRNLLERKQPPQQATPMERSLYLDSAACTLMRIVGESAPEPLVRRYMVDRAILAAWSGIFRDRWNGVAAEMIRAWFIFGRGAEFAADMLAMESDPKRAVGGLLSTRTAAALEGIDNQRIRADIDGAATDALRGTVLDCRRVPFGAERALSYLAAVEAELVNLELCLSAVVNNIDRAVTASRLRREYA
ncbi:MAG: hypothetical protein LBT97_05595 [Planctomycetota bacterium]|jgi:hypothetical protein|nr:hypothetical protein [Planctomycetota bacterium]